MQRSIAHTFFTLLLTISYLWGGCISCEQFFMRPGSKSDCCKARPCSKAPVKPVHGSKPLPAPQDCQTMPLDRYQGTQTHSEIGATWLPVPAIPGTDLFLSSFTQPRAARDAEAIADSPPDLYILNASLLL